MPTERVTVTLPADVVEDIDRRERNRSRFILDAVRRELKRRQREELKRSLQNPHPETSELADAGFADWGARLPDEKASDLVDFRAGRAVRWVPGRGWIDEK
jgi:Arc/MetJ-type ribon-helix-helix transcriptional regulator